MNISGMRPYEGFYEYNSIKAVALRSQQIAAVQNASGDEELSGGSSAAGTDSAEASADVQRI